MSFKVVYVLTSNKLDYYYQQLMISIKSLKYYMPKTEVDVLVDTETYTSLEGNRKEIFNLVDIKKIAVPNQYNQKEKSRYLKTTMRRYIEGDFLFIDCDTVICDDFSNSITDDLMAMVLDRNCKLLNWRDKGESIKMMACRCGFNLTNCDRYFNSGVIWVRDSIETHFFFEEWHRYWKETLKFGMCVDQLSLNYVIYDQQIDFIGELGGEWNCQVSLNPAGTQYISNAHIIHYFNTKPNSPYLLCDETIIRSYENDPRIEMIILNPRAAFKTSYLITCREEEDELLNSKQGKVLKMLYEKNKLLFNFNEKLLSCLIKLKNKIRPYKRWDKY